MSFSAHRPGRFGSDGKIAFESDLEKDQNEGLYLSDLLAQREREAASDPDAETQVIEPELPNEEEPTKSAAEFAEMYGPSDEEPVAVGDEQENETEVLADDAETQRLTDPEFSATLFGSEENPDPVPTVAPVSEARTRRVEQPRVRRGAMRRLAILGGAEGVILDKVPTETSRYVQMFFVLAGTALISGLSMFFALIIGVQILAWLAVPLAIIWALIIYNLDRFLTSSMKSTRSWFKLFMLALPRVLMAALIGIVVAEPMVLQIFHNDVQREVNATNITQAQSDQKTLSTGPEKQALDAASARLEALQSQASTGVVAGTSTTSGGEQAAQATIDTLNTRIAEQQKVIDKARAIYQCELTGQGAGTVEGCTGLSGQGASSDAAKSQLDQAQQTYDGLAADLRKANEDLANAQKSGASATSASEANNRQQAKDELPAAQKTYDAAREAYNARAEDVSSANAGASGLLSQISALNRLGEREPTLKWAHWLIAALFFMIELLPVLVKVLTSHGGKTLYEEAEEIQREVELDRAKANGWKARARIAQDRAGELS